MKFPKKRVQSFKKKIRHIFPPLFFPGTACITFLQNVSYAGVWIVFLCFSVSKIKEQYSKWFNKIPIENIWSGLK